MAVSQYEKDKIAKKARAEALKVQQQIAPLEADPNDVKIVPTTFKEKLSNFWYHYKFHLIVGVFLVGIATHLFITIFFPYKVDATLNIISENSFEGSTDYLTMNIDKVLLDYSGNGKIDMAVDPIQISTGSNSDLQGEAFLANQTKLVANTGDNERFLYLLDEASYKEVTEMGMNFKDLSEFDSPNIDGDKYYLKDTSLNDILGLDNLLDNMFLCIVDYGAITNKKSKFEEIYNNEYDFLKHMIEYK